MIQILSEQFENILPLAVEWVEAKEKVILGQIVPVKVKGFQMVPNETKSQLKNWNRINCL
jgi:hypothetical protein